MRQPTVLVVASDQELRHCLQYLVRTAPFQLLESPGKSTLSRFFENNHPDLIVIGPAVEHPWETLHIVRLVRQWTRHAPIIVVTTQGSEELAVSSMRAGVSDYFRVPVEITDLGESIRRLLADYTTSDNDAVGTGLRDARVSTPLIGTGGEAERLRASIDTIAATDSNVLITGETGTGKELTAALIHGRSHRCKYPFVSINCAAIPDSLLESELFGYERGAFTGAASSNVGRVSRAHRGTAFLDEIGDLSPIAQAKVLRLVEDKEVSRLGSTRSVLVDARIVTATNQNLPTLVENGRFRSDLYFRLNVARIHLRPLRERRDDIPPLLAHYVATFRRRFGREVDGFTATALEALTAYDWPGNVRELKNVVERVVMSAALRLIALADLPEECRRGIDGEASSDSSDRVRLLAALSDASWNKSKAARALGCSRMTLYRKMAKGHLGPPAEMHKRRA
jgi:DNA-binding NtrC family response regulator